MKKIIKKCRHPDAAVRCEHKNWKFIPGKDRAVRVCAWGGACVKEKK